jgi:hypothetical protein
LAIEQVPTASKKVPPAPMAREEEAKPSPPDLVLRSALKVPPTYVAPEEKANIPPPEKAIEFMMTALTATLQGLRSDMQDLQGRHVAPNTVPTCDQARQLDPPFTSAPSGGTPRSGAPLAVPPEPKPILVQPAAD